MEKTESSFKPDVLAIIGTGGMGVAVAQRCGAGKTILLGDFNTALAEDLAEKLRGNGHSVEAVHVDVGDRMSVRAFAQKAALIGNVTAVVHTAGLSPTQADTKAILTVDFLGTALVLDEFAKVIAPGGAGVFISSMSAYMIPALPPEVVKQLALTPTDDLLSLKVMDVKSPQEAYVLSKRANHLRVQAMSLAWGARGARVNSISPGVISTPMGRQEMEGPSGSAMRGMIAGSGTKRIGTPEDIAAAVEFLLSRKATFITGIDLLVDGGVIASMLA